MRGTLLAVCGIAVLGCQATPVRTTLAPPAKPARLIPLFGGEVEADAQAIQQAVLAYVPPGTPMDEAQDFLKKQGFRLGWGIFATPHIETLHEHSMTPKMDQHVRDALKLKDKALHPVAWQADMPVLQPWQQIHASFCVNLFPDAAGRLADVGVDVELYWLPDYAFFQHRPELQEPVGLPLDQARARMEAAGFHCSVLPPHGKETAAPSSLLCQAFNEGILGGSVIRVRLDVDPAGVVGAAAVLPKDYWFDNERCLWLHGDESTTEAAYQITLFPLREGSRCALLTLVWLVLAPFIGAGP